MAHRTPPRSCTCGNAGRCGYCPSVAATAAREGRAPAQRTGIGPVGTPATTTRQHAA